MYRVLYRKWRPKTFDDVVGQSHVTKTLKTEIKENHLSHAYLFTGSRGTGKTSCAKIFAKAVNCLHPVNGNPCNECEVCKEIDRGSLVDVVEMDAASNRGINDIRDIQEIIETPPSKVKYRVYIVDEVHMLSNEAFNALLKTIEEPPSDIIFIFATTDVQKVPQTILSRCQRYDFHRISAKDIINRLKFIADKENVTVTEDAATMIARISDGCMRDALSLFDACINKSSNVDSLVVSDVAGVMDASYLYSLSHAFKEKDVSKALAVVNDLYNSSYDSEKLCRDLLNHFRNILIVKSVVKPKDILVCTDEELNSLKDISEIFSADEIFNITEILANAVDSIKSTENRRTQLEMAIIRICSRDVPNAIASALSRISELEKRIDEISKELKQDFKQNEEAASTVTRDNIKLFDEKPNIKEPDSDLRVFDDDFNGSLETPIFDDDPVKNEEEPELPGGDMADAWDRCVLDVEKNCAMFKGSLNGSTIEINGSVITVSGYREVFPAVFNAGKDELLKSIKKFFGQDKTVRLGSP